jgi:hypothetical protein
MEHSLRTPDGESRKPAYPLVSWIAVDEGGSALSRPRGREVCRLESFGALPVYERLEGVKSHCQ